MNLFKVEELNKRAEELIDEFGDIDNYDEFCDKCGRSAITFGLFDYLEKEFENPYDKEKEPNMFWRFEESGRWINFFKKIWKYMKKGETNMKPLKEEVETKTFSDKALFDDFKDSIGGRCFNKDSVYRWIYKLTDIKPTTEEVYKIMDGWVKSKWAYKKQNEQTGADFYYFDLKETVTEERKNIKRKGRTIKEERDIDDLLISNIFDDESLEEKDFLDETDKLKKAVEKCLRKYVGDKRINDEVEREYGGDLKEFIDDESYLVSQIYKDMSMTENKKVKKRLNERRKNINNSKLIKEEYNEEYANINIVNGEFADSATPYMVYIWCGSGYMLDRFLCFAEDEYDAINDTINWLWEQCEYDMVFDYDQVAEWVEEWMEDEKAELEELEKTYEEYKDNIGDTIDNKWSEFRLLEKEYERIKEDYEDQKDNYISSEFIANDDYSLFVRSENFGVEEIDEETAQKIVYQSKNNMNESKSIKETVNEGRKNVKRIMKEENENLKLVKSFKVLKIPFSEIGYFGKGTWNDAMTFTENNKKGWRLPNEDESILISEHFEDTAKELVWDTDFYFWTNEEDDDTNAISSYVGATEVTPIHLSLKDDINCVFLVR